MSEEAYSNGKDYHAFLKVLDGAKARGCEKIAIEIQRTPDPDALSCAMVIKHVCDKKGLRADITHEAPVGRKNNRLMLKRLAVSTLCYGHTNGSLNGTDCKPEQYDGFIFVDHSGGTSGWSKNGQISPNKILAVIDHHDLDKKLPEIPYENRQEVGASATLVGEFLMQGLLEEIGDTKENGLMKRLATGLMLGIRSDTDRYTKNLTPRDHAVYAFLSQFADINAVLAIENAPVPKAWLGYWETALRTRRELESNALIAGIGHVSPEERDAIAYVADRFVEVEGYSAIWVVGIQPKIYDFSVRTRQEVFDYGFLDVLAKKIHPDGSGGGKEGSGGMQVPNDASRDSMMNDGSSEWKQIQLERVLQRLAAELGG